VGKNFNLNLIMPIYTKKGDKGRTSLGSGVRVFKDSARVDCYGTIDELNANLGVINANLSLIHKKYARFLQEVVLKIQDDLFSICAYLANPANSNLITHLPQRTLEFEKYIDEMTTKTGEIENFTVPGGTIIAAQFHVSRTITRRAERALVTLIKKEKVNEDVVKYINRLSDLLFTMNRFANHSEKVKETIWKRR
jgi:cob(I)alamin adenosyltransferase